METYSSLYYLIGSKKWSKNRFFAQNSNKFAGSGLKLTRLFKLYWRLFLCKISSSAKLLLLRRCGLKSFLDHFSKICQNVTVIATALKVGQKHDPWSPYTWLKFQSWRVCICWVMNWTVEWYAIFIKIIKSFVFLTDHNSTTEGPFELTLEDYNTAFQSLQHCTSRKKICDSPPERSGWTYRGRLHILQS